MMKKARRLGTSLYRAYKQEEKQDCGKLLLDWVKECFWGAIIKDHLPVFDAVWNILNEKKHTKNNTFDYGDYDYSVWVEYPKEEDKRVIIAVCHCAVRDDNTTIFIESGRKWLNTEYNLGYDFRVATVWPREKSNKRWPNDSCDRNIDIPSLNTYRKRDFHYGYYDCRDKGHVLHYRHWGNRVENASWSEEKIYWALWALRGHLEALKEADKGR